MALSEDRYSMPADRYLTTNYVGLYLEDAILQLLSHREENPKVEPLKFLSQYFSSLRDGNHVMFREFAFIRSTPHNRASFIRLFWRCFRSIGKKGDLLSIHEYHSLLGLLCTDFPFKLVQKTARIVLIDDALDCLISFSDFIYAFQAQFYYEEFLDKCSELYQSVLQSTQSPRDPVIVPTSREPDGKGIHQNSHSPADGLDSMQYFRAVFPLCDRANYSVPPASALKEILFSSPRISFYGFLMAIAKNEAINQHIGRLPPKTELLDGVDTDLSYLSFKVTSGHSRISSEVSTTTSGSDNRASLSSVQSASVNASLPIGLRSRRQEKPRQHGQAHKHTTMEISDDSDDDDDTSSDSSDLK